MRRTQVAYKLNAQPGEFITRERAIDFAPTLIAINPHESRSARYAQTRTIETIDAMQSAGFGLTSVQKVDARKESKKGFEKHLLRFAPLDCRTLDRHEIVNFNSHDGTTADVFMLGVYRYACANNVITGSTFEEMRIRHNGQANQKALEAAAFMVAQFAKLDSVVDAWKSITLSPSDYCELFMQAAALVVPPDADNAQARKLAGNVVSAFSPVRSADTGRDLWTAYNVAQERIMSGGLRTIARNEEGRTRYGRTRGVNAIDATVKLNRQLWDVAAKFAA